MILPKVWPSLSTSPLSNHSNMIKRVEVAIHGDGEIGVGRVRLMLDE